MKILKNGIDTKWILLLVGIVAMIGIVYATPIIGKNIFGGSDVFIYGDISNTTGGTLKNGTTNLSMSGGAEGFNGNASLTLTYTTDDGRTVGQFVFPVYGTTTDITQFLSAYNLKHGVGDNGSSPVPAGVKGMLSGYEANIDTAQTYEDLQIAESGHGFGATIHTRSGARYNILDGIIHITNVSTQVKGINIAFNNTIGGTEETDGYMVQTFEGTGAGQYALTNGYYIYGNVSNAAFSSLSTDQQGDFLKLKENSTGYVRFNVSNIGQIKASDGNPGYRIWIDPTSVNPIIRLNNSIRDYDWQAVNSGDYLRLNIGITGDAIKIYNTGATNFTLPITMDSLTDVGNAYACINSAGALYRSATLCV